MKQIINIQEKFGAELHTRQVVERLAASLNVADSYLLDMSGVMQISRSAADELYNLTHGDMSVDLINVEPFVEKMLSPQNTPQNGLQNEPQKLIAQLIPRQQQKNKHKNLHTSAFFCTFAGKFGYNYNFRR